MDNPTSDLHLRNVQVFQNTNQSVVRVGVGVFCFYNNKFLLGIRRSSHGHGEIDTSLSLLINK